METLLIHVGDPQAAGFPEDLCVDDGTDSHWFEHPMARGVLADGQLPPWPERPGGAIPAETLRSTGRGLYDALTAGSVGQVWQDRWARPDQRVLLDIRPDELRRLPWELLCTPDEGWLFEDESRPALRARMPFAGEARPLTGPVRLLVVIGDPEDQYLGAEEELRAVYEGLSSVPCCWQVHVLRAPGPDDTRRAFREFAPHILHFVGHGKLDPSGAPALEIMRAAGPWALTAGFVAGALERLADPLRLVVLNACRTADPGGGGLVRGLADAFFRIGTLAVLAMQGDIATDPAVRFAEQLYGQLAAGAPLDRAVAHARNDLHWADGTRPHDRVLPVLTVQADPPVILQWPDPIDHGEVIRAHGEEFDGPRWLVGRGRDHHRVADRMAAGTGPSGLLVVTGPDGVGKSELVRSCILTSRWQDIPVVYVSLPKDRSFGLVELFEAIAQGVLDWLGPDTGQKVADFRSVIQDYRPEAVTAPAGPAGAVVPPLPGRPVEPGDYLERMIGIFRMFITSVAEGRPLLVVLDNVLRAEQYGQVVDRVLAAAQRWSFRPVRIVAVDTELRAAVPGTWENNDEMVLIDGFERASAPQLVREYCARRHGTLVLGEDVWRDFVKVMEASAGEYAANGERYLRPEKLKLWESVARTLCRERP